MSNSYPATWELVDQGKPSRRCAGGEGGVKNMSGVFFCSRCGGYSYGSDKCKCGRTAEEASLPTSRKTWTPGNGRDEFEGDWAVVCQDQPQQELQDIDEQEGNEDRYENTIIITRHAGMIAWLRARGIEAARVIEHATIDDVRGRIVYGTVPLALAADALEVWTVSMPRLRPDQRGVDLTPEEMDASGAALEGFRVTRL